MCIADLATITRDGPLTQLIGKPERQLPNMSLLQDESEPCIAFWHVTAMYHLHEANTTCAVLAVGRNESYLLMYGHASAFQMLSCPYSLLVHYAHSSVSCLHTTSPLGPHMLRSVKVLCHHHEPLGGTFLKGIYVTT